MNILIRTDASSEIGTGHVMRCMTLAEQLMKGGATITFICRRLKGDLTALLIEKGFIVKTIETDGVIAWQQDACLTSKILLEQKQIDWLIVDHYQLDEKWEQKIRPFVSRILVIDDLANRRHDCDIVVDQNYYLPLEERYNKLVPESCVKLLGPKYTILRQEFYTAKKLSKERNGKMERLLIFFGGSDPTNETEKTLHALERLNNPFKRVDVVVGNSNPNKHVIEKICKRRTIFFHCQIDYMAELMALADLSIGAGGTTTWERCYLGLPTITIETASNQREIVNTLSSIGVISHLGTSLQVDEKKIAREIETLTEDEGRRKMMSRRSFEIMESDTGAPSIAAYMLGGNKNEPN
ncbi:MAG: UDP-2,4-diacetamido-2,4,6-trideoxy-beta-L-altropyranose hydrolase [Bacillus sp. (in: firmicutes)]